MTLEELFATVAAEIPLIAQVAPGATNTPIITGRLWSSIKYEQIGPTNWRIYIDEGNMSLEEWESDPSNAETQPMGFAPYADKVNQRNPYWTRIGMFTAQKLATALGAKGRYDSQSRGE